MKTITASLRHALAFCFFLFIVNSVYSQKQTFSVERQWVAAFGQMDTTPPALLRVAYDSHGNIDIAGTLVDKPIGTDLLVAQFSPSGALNWFQKYFLDSTNHNESTAIAVDDSDNIYVVGYMDSTTNFNYSYYVAQKYNSGGTLQWTTNTATHGFEIPANVAVDAHYVYVSGGGIVDYPTGLDYIILKMNRVTGAIIWEKLYDYANLYDASPALALTPYNGGVVVTGGSDKSSTAMEFATVFYDTSGNKIHTMRADGSVEAIIAGGLAVKTDAAGYTYVTGMIANTGNGYDIRTIKYDSTGTEKWHKDFDYQNLDDVGHDLLVDADSNVYVCGQAKSTTTGNDVVLLKYDYKGDLIWQKFFDGVGRNDTAGKMCFDAYGDIILTGESQTNDGNYQFLTLAYDTSGNLIFKDFYGGCSGDSKALDIKADGSGNIYVAGSSYNCDSAKYMNTVIKYAAAYFVVPPDTETANSNMLFYPNYGQIVDTSQTVRMDVFYYTINQNPKLYFDTSGVSFVFAKCDTDTISKVLVVDTLERIDMTFWQSDTRGNNTSQPFVSATHDNPYLNYFLAQCPNGIVNVKGSEKLVQKNVFKSIDVVYANNGAGMKFYFIVYPGGDASNLILHFDGHQSLAINSNNLDVSGILGTFEYLMPQVYQIDTNNTRIALGWTASYNQLGGSDIGIDLGGGTYDGSLPLVIECERQGDGGSNVQTANNLEYSTYYGDIGLNIAANVRTDNNTGETYVTGWTASATLPWVTALSVQPISGGSWDAFVYKMHNDTTNRLLANQWITYYGGSAVDQGYDVACASPAHGSDVYLVGGTYSLNFPQQHSARANPAYEYYQTNGLNQLNSVNFGALDGFIVRLTNDGQFRKWSTYFGGQGNDRAWSVAVDSKDNMNVVGHTDAYGFPLHLSTAAPLNATGGYNQTAYYGGSAFIARFDSSDNMLWSTYFGTSGENEFLDVRVSDINHIYATGFTQDSTAAATNWNGTECPCANTGAFQMCDHGQAGVVYQQGYGGGHYDNMIVEFDDSCRLQWSTYFGGKGSESGHNAKLNVATYGATSKLLHFVGNTSDGDGFPLKNKTGAYYQDQYIVNATYYNDINNAVIAEFLDRQQIWTTFFGMYNTASCVAYNNGILYVGGRVGSQTGAITTSITCTPPTSATDPFPLCNTFANSYMQSYGPNVYYGGGGSDAYLAAFDNTGAILGSSDSLGWCTFLGGSNSEIITGISTALLYPYEALYATGATNSDSSATTFAYPHTKPVWAVTPPVYYQTRDAGSYDALIMRFTTPGVITGIKEVNKDGIGVNIYPNPSNGMYQLKGTNEGLSYISVRVFDVLGRTIKNYDLPKQKGEYTIPIDLSREANGVYAISVTTKKGLAFTKVIKQN